MKKYILFDLDGTLTDPKEGITQCVCHALRFFGIEKAPDEVVCFIGPPLKEQFMEFASLSSTQAEKAVEVYRERYVPKGIFENKLISGIIPLLAELKKNGAHMAIATSKPTIFARQIAEKYEIAPFFDGIFGAETDGRNTDKATVIKIAMEALGANKEAAVMVGDRIFDIDGAQKAGIASVGVSYGYAQEGELEKSGVKHIASDAHSLLKILLEL